MDVDDVIPADEPTQAFDEQSRAYREMGPDDAVADHEIPYYTVRTHDPLVDVADIPGPDEYERFAWDAGREDPH